MKITNATLEFSTQYRQLESQQRNQQISVSQQQQGTLSGSLTGIRTNAAAASTLVRLDSSQQLSLYSRSSVTNQTGNLTASFEKAHAMQSVLSRFYTQNVRMLSIMEHGSSRSPTSSAAARATSMTVSEHFLYQKEQQLGFAARGNVTTEDGRNVNFEFYANATQQFRYESGSGAFAAQLVQRHDPLVINFDGGFNNLSDTLFEFDLTSDGNKEQLAFTGRGSGFLVFDRNGDGIINNGSEMFGARTGDGFAELAEYDEDGNGFIDSGDSIFNQLQVFTRDEQGKDQLLSLSDLNIGAISVSSGLSPFAINDLYNNELGMARATGIFLTKDGQVGSVQQIDLTQRDLDKEARDKAAFSAPSDPLPPPEQTADSEAAPLSGRFADILDAMEKLNQITNDLLNRSNASEADQEPKSLLAQLVDTLEAYRIEQAEKKRTEKQQNEK